jgi:hypothetical protein
MLLSSSKSLRLFDGQLRMRHPTVKAQNRTDKKVERATSMSNG